MRNVVAKTHHYVRLLGGIFIKNVIRGAVVAVSLIASSAAIAQISANITIGQPERTKIREYVVKEKVRPWAAKETVVVGSTLPGDVELYTVPSDWGSSVSEYRYVYANDKVVLVDPKTRRVVYVMD